MDLLELLRKRGIDGDVDVDFLREALRVLVDGIMDEWQPASVALATPDAAPRRAVVVRHFPSPQLPTRRPRLSLVQSVAEYGCTLNLPGSVITPTRFVADPAISRNPRPGSRHRQPSCRPRRSRCGSRSQKAIAASCNAFPASTAAAGSPAALAVSSRNAAHHNPDRGSGLAPATPAQGCCWGRQLAAARCSRAAAVIAAAAANSSRSRATSWSEGGPSSPDPRPASARLPYRTAALANCARVRVCAFRSSGMLAVVIGLLRAPSSFPNLMIFSPILPTDVNCLLIRHRNSPP